MRIAFLSDVASILLPSKIKGRLSKSISSSKDKERVFLKSIVEYHHSNPEVLWIESFIKIIIGEGGNRKTRTPVSNSSVLRSKSKSNVLCSFRYPMLLHCIVHDGLHSSLSNDIISCFIISNHILSFRVVSFYFVSYFFHVVLHPVVSYHTLSY